MHLAEKPVCAQASHHHQPDWLPTEKQRQQWLHTPRSTVRSPQGGRGDWLDLRRGDVLVLKKTEGGRPFGKQNDLATAFLLISERSLEGKHTQNSILLYLGVEDQPGPGSPTAWASFQACSSPTGSWAMWPRTGLWGRGAWPIRMRNCTVLGDVAWWALRASLVFFPLQYTTAWFPLPFLSEHFVLRTLSHKARGGLQIILHKRHKSCTTSCVLLDKSLNFSVLQLSQQWSGD